MFHKSDDRTKNRSTYEWLVKKRYIKLQQLVNECHKIVCSLNFVVLLIMGCKILLRLLFHVSAFTFIKLQCMANRYIDFRQITTGVIGYNLCWQCAQDIEKPSRHNASWFMITWYHFHHNDRIILNFVAVKSIMIGGKWA